MFNLVCYFAELSLNVNAVSPKSPHLQSNQIASNQTHWRLEIRLKYYCFHQYDCMIYQNKASFNLKVKRY